MSKYTEKNLWCREVYWKVIETNLGYRPFKESNGCRLRYCNRDAQNCRGAHTKEELSVFKHITDFNNIDKSKYNWVYLYNQIIDVLEKSNSKVILKEHKENINNIKSLNFFDVLRLWRDYACYYRKLIKELPSKSISQKYPSHTSGYTYSDDVPDFKLHPKIEETAWCLSRLCRWCPEHLKFREAIQKKQLVTIWDICLATGINCKEGVHEFSEKICEDDFLNGSCSCDSLQSIIEKVENIQTLMKSANVTQLNKYKKDLESLLNGRLLHYSEYGMIPFNQQLKNYIDEQAKQVIVTQQPIIKDACFHDLIETKTIAKPVVKVIKLGKK